MAELRIRALGRARVLHNQDTLRFATRRSQDLLCYLLMHRGQALGRDVVAEDLWPDQPPGRARRCLSTALWRLRKTLASSSSPTQPYVLIEGDTLAFNTGARYSFDVECFERAASCGLASCIPCRDAEYRALEQARSLYGGDLLEGCYDDWCLPERERLRLLHLHVLKHLQRHYRALGDFGKAVEHGRRLLELDPLQEDVHRELMLCYSETGQRSLALQQFHRCRDGLLRELQLQPTTETWAVYRQIRGAKSEYAAHETIDGAAALPIVLDQFRDALDALESAWQSLCTASAQPARPRQSGDGRQGYRQRG